MKPLSACVGISLLALVVCDTRLFGSVSQRENAEPSPAHVEDRVVSADERSRMERYVADLQRAKTVVKSFQGPSGETIDCVDIMSQPSLERRGMEDHQIQFEPFTQPLQSTGTSRAATATPPQPEQLYTLTGETCPDQTAPMAHLTMTTLRRFRTLDEFLSGEMFLSGETQGATSGGGSPTHEYAHLTRTVNNWGAESILNLWSPFVERADEFSLSRIWVQRGNGASHEAVHAGWQVYRDLYGDWRAHLFIYFTPDNYGSGGCYNVSCDAFVQVNNTVYLGGGFTSYSVLDGPQWEIKLLLYKDGPGGHWWLRYYNTWVGYYPRNLFDDAGLRNHAARIGFGGEVLNRWTDGRHTLTDMGSGRWPTEFGAAYQRAVRYVDTSNVYRRATGTNWFESNGWCYSVNPMLSSDDPWEDPSWEQYFTFGGWGYYDYDLSSGTFECL